MSGGNHHLRWVYQGWQESFHCLPITNTNDNMHWRMFRQKKHVRKKSIDNEQDEEHNRFKLRNGREVCSF
ncbi:hypothetical protein Hdeb2414_s0022g00609891 [Helianthus debilis subsp. tardiflorus]